MIKKFLLINAPLALLLFGCTWFVTDILTACLIFIGSAVLFILMDLWTNFVENHFDD